jgi:hypothetical protein
MEIDQFIGKGVTVWNSAKLLEKGCNSMGIGQFIGKGVTIWNLAKH